MNLSRDFNADRVICFEGIRGSGKSTLMKALKEKLEPRLSARIDDTTRDYPILAPYRINPITNLDEAMQDSRFFEMLCWAKSLNRPSVDVALVDRFLLSTFVYTSINLQDIGELGAVGPMRSRLLYPLGLDALAGCKLVYVDCPAEIAESRVSRRGARNNYDLQKENKAREMFLAEITSGDYTPIVVNGVMSPEENALHLMKELFT